MLRMNMVHMISHIFVLSILKSIKISILKSIICAKHASPPVTKMINRDDLNSVELFEARFFLKILRLTRVKQSLQYRAKTHRESYRFSSFFFSQE